MELARDAVVAVREAFIDINVPIWSGITVESPAVKRKGDVFSDPVGVDSEDFESLNRRWIERATQCSLECAIADLFDCSGCGSVGGPVVFHCRAHEGRSSERETAV